MSAISEKSSLLKKSFLESIVNRTLRPKSFGTPSKLLGFFILERKEVLE